MDPIFWVLHPMFEKALHLLLLSPEYSSAYDFTWEDSSCYGSGLTDRLPFTGAWDGRRDSPRESSVDAPYAKLDKHW